GNRPEVKIFKSDLSDNEALSLEIELIEKYGRRDLGTGCLCNHTSGGDGSSGYSHSDATKLKMSQAQYGRIHSIDSLIKMSKASRGRLPSVETKTKMRAANPNSLSVTSFNRN